MSINTTSLNTPTNARDLPFILAIGEKLQYISPTSRQSLSIQLVEASEKHQVRINAGTGKIFVTNHRLVYVAHEGDIETFSVAFLRLPALQFSHALKSPWFGANYWEFLFVSGGVADGFPFSDHLKGSLKFSEGGLFEFVEIMNRVINDSVNNTHIDEDLPRYSET